MKQSSAHPHAEILATLHRIYTDLAHLNEERVRNEEATSAKIGKNAQDFLHALTASELPDAIKQEGKTRVGHALGQKPADVLSAMSWVVDRVAKTFKKDMAKAHALFAAPEGVKMVAAYHNHVALAKHEEAENQRLLKLASKKESQAHDLLDEITFEDPSSPAEEGSNALVQQLLYSKMSAQEALHTLDKIKSEWSKSFVNPNQLSLFASQAPPVVRRVASRYLLQASK